MIEIFEREKMGQVRRTFCCEKRVGVRVEVFLSIERCFELARKYIMRARIYRGKDCEVRSVCFCVCFCVSDGVLERVLCFSMSFSSFERIVRLGQSHSYSIHTPIPRPSSVSGAELILNY